MATTIVSRSVGWLACGLIAIAAPAYAQLAPPNAAGITFGHVHLNVKDIDAPPEAVGGALRRGDRRKGPLVARQAARHADRSSARPTPTGGSEGTVMDHFGFKVRRLWPRSLTAWRAAGYQVGREFTGAEGFPNAYLIGPDNLKIEMQEDKSLPVEDRSAYHLHFLLADYVKLRDWYVETFSLESRKRGTIATPPTCRG